MQLRSSSNNRMVSHLKLLVVTLLFLSSALGIQAAASSTPSISFTEIMTSKLLLLPFANRRRPPSSCSAMAFCNVHHTTQQRILPSVRFQHYFARYHPKAVTTSTSTTIFSSKSSLSSPDNYYTAASSISNVASGSTTKQQNNDEPFPNWWPISQSMSKYVTFSEHIAHVIIPDAADTTDDADGARLQRSEEKVIDGTTDPPYSEELCEGMTCGQVIEWVLRAARHRNETEMNDSDDSSSPPERSDTTTKIREQQQQERYKTIMDEYQQGEQYQSSITTTSNTILDPAYRHDPNSFPQLTHYANNLCSAELLAMGSIWSLPYSATSSKSSSKSTTTIMDRFDPSNGVKPTRLNMGNYNDTVSSGDYFRIHFNPRRFVDTNKYDWSENDGVISNDGGDGKPGVIVRRDDKVGYLIINKPSNIPVHARVDNLLENVASSVGRMLWLERREELLSSSSGGGGDLTNSTSSSSSDGGGNTDEDDVEYWPNGQRKRAKKKSNQKQTPDKLVYVATPQRLDQNTSGLLVIATRKSFASYFAKLLRTKTSGQLRSGGSSQSSCGVHKSYRCLVCVTPNTAAASSSSSSMASEVERLQKFQAEGTIIKHFLEPSIRAPKRFVESVPDEAENPESWAECLLKITNVTNVCTVVGNDPSNALATDLWGEFGKPTDCVGIIELEIELLTGRTHQIRGQMAALGFPLVGDVQYGGAVPNTSSEYMKNCRGRAEGFLDSETLCLQCATLEFLDPDASDDSDAEKVQRSDRWLSFHLDGAFWTPFVERYHAESESLSGAAMTFEGVGSKMEPNEQQTSLSTDDQLLPPRVQLSPGSHKYIVIRATSVTETEDELWFVRSASPEECGGPYHANVAQDLLDRLKLLGYNATVMGGGRIDFLANDEVAHAHVFGFSYGFGKGDHEKVATIIEENSDIIATFDMSDGLY